jgi:hypothetical protein
MNFWLLGYKVPYKSRRFRWKNWRINFFSQLLKNPNSLISIVEYYKILFIAGDIDLKHLKWQTRFTEVMTKTLRNLTTLRLLLPWEHDSALCISRCKDLPATCTHGPRAFRRVMCTKTDSKEKGYIYVDNKMSTEAIENSAWVSITYECCFQYICFL